MLTEQTPPISAGYAEADLMAPLGGSMPGYFDDRKADGVLDPLKAKCLYLRSPEGDTAIALVALDLIGLNAAEVKLCREEVRRRTGLPHDRVWIHATHTHTGAMVPRFFTSDAEAILPGIYVGQVDDDWVRQLPDRVAAVVESALRAARPTSVDLARGTVEGLAFYRRFKMKDGTIQTNPGRGNPQVVGPNGHPDPTLTVLRFGASRALLVIFGLHPDTVGGRKYSADYPHHLTESIRAALGADWNVLFLNAACGNINHIDVNNPTQRSGEQEARRIGQALGRAALEALGAAAPLPDVTLRAAARTVPSRLRTVPEETVQQAERLLKEEPEKARSFNGLFAPAALVLGRTRDREYPAEVSALRIGTVGLVGMPGEYFIELARPVQHDSPFEDTRIIGLTNGSFGYIPHEAAYAEGGYEAGYRSARFRPGTGEAWARAAVELLQGLAQP